MITSIGLQQSLIRRNDYKKNSQSIYNKSQSLHFGNAPVEIEGEVQRLLAQGPELAKALEGSKTRQEVVENAQSAINNIHKIKELLDTKIEVIENVARGMLERIHHG